MTLIEILEQVKQLKPQERHELVQQVLKMDDEYHLTVYDLLAMSPDERERVVAQAFAKASHETFEDFEAYDEMDFNDDAF